MKSFIVLAALLLAFQVKAQSIEPAQWQVAVQNWQLDTLSPLYYDDISEMNLKVDLGAQTLKLQIQTDRGPREFTARILKISQNGCGAKVFKAFSEDDNVEIVVTDFRQGICSHDKSKGQIQIVTKHFERKSLRPSIDTFHAAAVQNKRMLKLPFELITSEEVRKMIERRNRLQMAGQGL